MKNVKHLVRYNFFWGGEAFGRFLAQLRFLKRNALFFFGGAKSHEFPGRKVLNVVCPKVNN